MNQKPNIVFIMSDDHGSWGMHCAGNEELITPNLDRLREKGMLCENFFCTSPVCSPARMSIMTGKMPSAHGVHDWLHKGHLDYEYLAPSLRELYEKNELPWQYHWGKGQLTGDKGVSYLESHVSYTDILKDLGYRLGISGKWHMGDSFHPQAGFDDWKTIALGGDNYYYPIVHKGDCMDMLDHVYITDYITDHALAFMKEQRKEEPFYLSVHYTAPHGPWEAHHHPKEIYDLYDNCEFTSTPLEAPHKWAGGGELTEDYRKQRVQNLRGYFTAITAMDQGIGRILDCLEEMGLEEDTIVMFTSDNGMSMGHHGIFGKGNGTYPMNMYDTAVKVPMLISAPNIVAPGSKTEALLSHYDIFPTITELLGVSEKLPEGLPGNSMLPVLKGKDGKENRAIVVMDEYGPVRMVRTKEYKYIHRYIGEEHEFFDLIHDPGETINLYGNPDYEVLIEEYKARLESWFRTYSDERFDGKMLPVRGLGQAKPVNHLNGDNENSFI